MSKHQKPSISVIMGMYNSPHKEEVITSIESIINQNFSSWEFIICDDCSTDDTWSFLKERYGKDKRFVLIRNKKNGGLRVALNHCLKCAHADYIVRQDADDVSREDRLSILYRFMMEHQDVDVLGTAMVSFDENGEHGIIHPRKLKPTKMDFLPGSVVAHASTIMKKSAVADVGGYRVAWETTRCEDTDLYMRMYAAGKIIQNIDLPLYYVRQDEKMYSRRKYINRIKEAIVKYKGFRIMKMPFYAYIFIARPLVVGLIPAKMLGHLKQMRQKIG